MDLTQVMAKENTKREKWKRMNNNVESQFQRELKTFQETIKKKQHKLVRMSEEKNEIKDT